MVTTCSECLIARRDQQTSHCKGRRGPACARAGTLGVKGADPHLHQILYIGESGFSGTPLEVVIGEIRAETAERARVFGLSGALLLAKDGFAQLLEGSRTEVESCLAALRSNPHHANALLIEEGPVGVRQFGRWSVSYADPASFVGRVTLQALRSAALGGRREINRLVRLMVEASACNDDEFGGAALSAGDQSRTAA